MKRFMIAALVLPAALHAQQLRDSVITATATRSSVIIPDRVSNYVVVEGTGETPADANTRLDTKLKAVTEAIRGFGSAVTAERPIAYGVGLAQNPNGYPMPAVPTTYISRAVVRIQISRIDQMAATVAALLSAGATSVGSPTFESSALDSVRREKIAEAVAVARADATALAAALGGKLGALVDVSSTAAGPIGFSPNTQIVFDNRYNSGSAAAPAITVTTNVTIRYRIIR